ncbi:MAG TPA: flagellar export chaperone FliS [Candidatus Baltobacteraceae bacterium]|jgi:flagellar protein FliS|nr:flagellar export chaperone FliS [Candidatus Baltobacteraceae bacterium]
MTQRNNPWQSYRKVAIQTASAGQLVLLLYDGAINYLEKGLTGFNHQDPREFNQTINNNVIRAQAIIREMNARLDMERGAEVSENFRRLYNYFNLRLFQANFKKKREPIEEVIGHLRELRDSWAEMLCKGGANGDAAARATDLQRA